MQLGVIVPAINPRDLAALAAEAETAGWDGVFVWDPLIEDNVWIALGAAALVTERIRIGTMLTPVSRRRPWELAQEVATVDRTSNGRVILGVGLGAAEDAGFGRFGLATDRRTRAEQLDEGLDILDRMWSGEPFSYVGAHYQLSDVTGFAPVQRPRVPIWAVGAWPRPKSMRRVARCDGVVPIKMEADRSTSSLTRDDIAALRAWIAEHRNASTPFDIVTEGTLPDDTAAATDVLGLRADEGYTWFLDNIWHDPAHPNEMRSLDDIRARVRRGPPAAPPTTV